MALKACSSSEILECITQKTAKDVIRARDRISELPADILVNVLSLIQTRESVRTSILSKGWRNVWTSVPVIEINSCSLWEEYDIYQDIYQNRHSGSIGLPFEDWFKNFVDGLISSYDLRCVRELRLCCDDLPHLRKLIAVVTRLDDFKKLDLSFYSYKHAMLHSSTFICKKLVILTLSHDITLNLPSSVYLPNLKRLHLVSVSTLDVDSVQKLLTGCPVLEKLYIERHYSDDMKRKILCILSSSLKSLTFYSGCFNQSARLLRMVIYAPNLEQLDLIVDGTDKVEITSSMTSLATVDLGVFSIHVRSTDNKINVLEVLMKMSNTKCLYLSAPVVESLPLLQSLDYFPMLKNLRHCEVDIFRCSWPILSVLLESSPNLISFVCYKEQLIGGCNEMRGQFHPPKCVMLYLEEIELHRFGLYGDEMEIVSYFLENAPALKTMSVTLDSCLNPEAVPYFYGKVLELPKASTACEIYVGSL